MTVRPPLDKARRVPFLDPVIALLVFAVSTLICYRLALINFDPHHTGVMYKTAFDISRGQVVYRDTYSQYGALTSLLQAAAILVLGPRATSVLFSTAFFYGLCFALFYVLSRRFFGRFAAVAIAALTLMLAPFWMWDFHPWSSVYALFFLLLTTLFMWLAEEKKRYLFTALAGISSALAFWCRQPVGLVCLLGTLLCPLFLWFLTRRQVKKQAKMRLLTLLCASAGAALCMLAFLIPLAALGALHDFARQNLAGMVTMATSRSQNGGVFGMALYRLFIAPLVEWGKPWVNYLWVLLPLMSLALFVLSAWRICRKNDDKEASARFIYALFAVASWHQYYPVSCYRHWFWAGFPSVLSAMLIITDLCRYLARKKQRRTLFYRLAVCLLVLLLFSPSVAMRVEGGFARITLQDKQSPFHNAHYGHLDGLYLSPAVTQHYTELFDDAALLQQRFPETNIVNATENGVNALFGENFCPIFNNADGFYYQEYPELLADYIAAERPIVFGPEAPNDTYRLWRTPGGYSGDPFEKDHHMPGSFYLPAELYDSLPAELR